MKDNSTEVVFIVDRSGSMDSCAKSMSQGFDEFINKQRQAPGECLVTAIQFDDKYEVLYQGVPVADVPGFELVPRGNTALFDAIGKTIASVGQRLAGLPENERPSKVVVVIITDGYENASTEYNRERVSEMIRHQNEKYSWQFVYLGANQDALGVANSFGVTNAATFAANAAGAGATMRSVSNSVLGYRSSNVNAPINYSQVDYDNEVGAGK